MKRFILVATLVVVGAALTTAGVAFIFWPAAFIVGGAYLLGFAFLIDLPDHLPAGQSVNIVDESEEPVATVVKVHG